MTEHNQWCPTNYGRACVPKCPAHPDHPEPVLGPLPRYVAADGPEDREDSWTVIDDGPTFWRNGKRARRNTARMIAVTLSEDQAGCIADELTRAYEEGIEMAALLVEQTALAALVATDPRPREVQRMDGDPVEGYVDEIREKGGANKWLAAHIREQKGYA